MTAPATPRHDAQVVTRFAPSPTGHLHVGGARTALFCWAYARRHDGRFMLRIEDTDQARSSDDSARGIMDDLLWLGIAWTDGPAHNGAGGDDRHVGPFFQARRLDHYNRCIDRLVEADLAYPAFDTPEALEQARREAASAKQTFRYRRPPGYDRDAALARMRAGEPHVIRLRAPDTAVTVHDQILGDVTYAAGEMDDFVLRKADGFPTYHFAVVVDDELMGVTHVLRAQEHLNNTPRHVALQRALGFRTPVYGHMPVIFNMDGSKMSKRDKAKTARAAAKAAIGTDPRTPDLPALAQLAGVRTGDLQTFLVGDSDALDVAERLARALNLQLPEIEVEDFRRAGYLPEAIVNFLALLGWNPGMKDAAGKDLEKFDAAFLARHFSLDRVGRGNAKFDRAKLLSFNADAIGALSDDAFTARWREHAALYEPHVLERLDERAMRTLAPSIRPRCRTLRDAARAIAFLFTPDDQVAYDPSAVGKVLHADAGAGLAILGALRDALAATPAFEPPAINAALDAFARANALGMGKVAQPLRVAITGTTVSPPLAETLAVLGRERTLARVDRCLRALAQR